MNESAHEQRVKILKKIEEYEENGIFDKDVEDDPVTITLEPDMVDYGNTKLSSKIKAKFSHALATKFVNKQIKEGNLIIKEVQGLENLNKVNGGAILTCNHFNPFDSFAVEKVFQDSKQGKSKKIYRVIREGNYTNFPGFYGFLFRNCYTLPLSSNSKTMIDFLKGVSKVLEEGNYVFICPEQSMWWNYKKPKPLKNGAFNIAVKNNVPVIPIFITLTESERLGEDGFPIMEYHVFIEKPIYKDKKLSDKENIEMMKDINYNTWKKVYEDFYQIPLQYTCDKVKKK